MIRRVTFTMLLLLLVPVMASAYNCWSVTKATSPSIAILQNAVTATDPTTGLSVVGMKTYATAATAAECGAITEMTYTVAPPAGYAVTQVRLDNVVQPLNLLGTYVIPQAGKTNRNLTVYFAPVTSAYTITTYPAAGGSTKPSFKTAANSDATVYVAPFTGFTLTGLTIDGVDRADLVASVAAAGSYTFSNVTANHTFRAAFTAAPVVHAYISTPDGNVYPDTTLLVDGSLSNTNVSGATYAWSTTAGTIIPTAPGAKTATFTVPATIGTSAVVTLSILDATSVVIGSDTVTFTVQDPERVLNAQCVACHSLEGGQIPGQWEASVHEATTHGPNGGPAYCSTCHNPAGTTSHPFIDKTEARAACIGCHTGDYAVHGGTFTNECTNCHNPHTLVVEEVGNVADPTSCEGCHTETTSVQYDEWAAGPHAADGHLTGTCQRCHGLEGAIAADASGWTGSYDFLIANQATLWTPVAPATSTQGVSCAACHDQDHTGGIFRQAYAGGSTTPWNPNQSGAAADQYDTCTICHTLTDNAGAVVGNYHDKGSANAGRTISDTHYDNPTTATVVEGYNIRMTSANPCADCHNVHTANVAIQEAWANSAHAGQMLTKKDDAASYCAESVTYFAAAGVTDCNVVPANVVFASNQTLASTAASPAAAFVSMYNAYDVTIVAAPVTIVTNDRITYINARKNKGAIDDADGNAWLHYNWDATASRGSCQRCHTATGIANFLNDPTTYNAAGLGNDYSHLAGWTSATGSTAQELLYCWGCHSDVNTATAAVPNLRNPGAITEVYAAATTGAPPATVVYPNVNSSNVCIGCHLGREIGQNVTNDTDTDGVRSFINSHYLTAGSTIFGVSGYEYAGRTYSAGFHQNVGVGNAYSTGTDGPCVSCHMTGPEPHSFEVVNYAIGEPTTYICDNCHTGLVVADLAKAKSTFDAALHELALALEAKGIYYYPAHPNFFTVPYVTGGTNTAFTNWAGPYGVSQWKDVMGAAFNYNVFHHDPGAYAHNRQYALDLIYDSIDFLYDGSVNDVGGTMLTVAKEEGEAGSHVQFSPTNPYACNHCHNSGLPGTETIATTLASAHTVAGQVTVSNVAPVANGVDLDVTFNVKVDGANKTNLDTVNAKYTFDVVSNNRTTIGTVTLANLGNGDYKITVPGADLTTNKRYFFRLQNLAETSAVPGYRSLVVADFPAAPKDVVDNSACVNCHGEPGNGYHYGYPNSAGNCVVCHDAANTTYPRYGTMIHGIHASEQVGNNPVYTEPVTGESFQVAYPSYMLNCSVCHKTAAQLSAINATRVNYDFCMTCHQNWKGFGDADFGGHIHTGYTTSTNCMRCHDSTAASIVTVADFHNGQQTGRGGLIWNGQDVAVAEGALVDMQITDVSKSGDNIVVAWTASYNGTQVNPCNAVATIGAPVFHAATADAITGQVAGAFSLLRSYAELDDWGNAGISTSPGQPASTNLSTTNTVCADNVATTTIALTAPEVASTASKGQVAIQGRAQVKLPYQFPSPSIVWQTYIEGGTQDVILVRSKSPTREFNMTDGSLPGTSRRAIVDTAGCLKCHVGSLYQHGGNRIDNVDLCVMCHNEASSEQNVRLLDGVTATEAYDGKVGMTYGFKSLLHAVHSANENQAVTMCYRTNGNYVWTGEVTGTPPNYPTVDTDFPYNKIVGDGAAALIYGSSAPHGTGLTTFYGTNGAQGILYNPNNRVPNPVTTANYDGTSEWGVYRAHNLYHPTYPQPLKNCLACHSPGTYGLPDATKAIATTVDAGTVGLGGIKPAQTANNVINANLNDDKVQGPASAACFSCHQAEMAPPVFHGNVGGFAPANFGARSAVPAESCGTCHQ